MESKQGRESRVMTVFTVNREKYTVEKKNQHILSITFWYQEKNTET